MPEAGLLEEPLQAMQERLTQLLADWPENPILMQLLALCHRLAGNSRPIHVHDKAVSMCK